MLIKSNLYALVVYLTDRHQIFYDRRDMQDIPHQSSLANMDQRDITNVLNGVRGVVIGLNDCQMLQFLKIGETFFMVSDVVGSFRVHAPNLF